MNTNTTAQRENDKGQTMPENGHCFWIDNNEIIDLDNFTILREGLKANMGLVISSSQLNNAYLVYVGY